jgi:5-methylcytosine-specific restriction endonuclease McrA
MSYAVRKSYALHKNDENYYFLRDKRDRKFLIDFLGGKCAGCGYSKDIRALQLDHKNSDGKKDRDRLGNRVTRYYVKHLEEAKEKLQVLCANCNTIKRIQYEENPQQPESSLSTALCVEREKTALF